jgi:DNA-binding MarR family transcriptional regulator
MTCKRCSGPVVTITGLPIGGGAAYCEPCARIIGERSARPLGEVTTFVYSALRRLGRPVTSREVAEACGVTTQRVSVALCKGVKLRTVERVGKLADGNQVLWRLTETGEAALELAQEQVPGVVARLAEAVGMEAMAL